MNIGAHVRGGGTLLPSLRAGEEIGATSIQIFTQSPRTWKPSLYAPEVLDAYYEAQLSHPTIRHTFSHATYLINLGTPNPELLEKSQATLTHNLSVGRRMGASGVVVHTGSHMGSGFEVALPQIARAYVRALDEADRAPAGVPECPILIENTAGAGGTVGRSFEEIGAIIDACGKDERLQVCVDTQHLWASGFDFSTPEGANALVHAIDTHVGLARLTCFHLNDSLVERGSNKDRHANIDEGTIGLEGLAALMGHPAMRDLPMILEVPGEKDGPRGLDVAAAERAWRRGIDIYETRDSSSPASTHS
jgi:deoxyribonuclease-4